MSLNKLKEFNVINDFSRFAVRGNVLDMAVGIVIGAAFGKIVSSLVSDILMPPIGMLLGGVIEWCRGCFGRFLVSKR